MPDNAQGEMIMEIVAIVVNIALIQKEKEAIAGAEADQRADTEREATHLPVQVLIAIEGEEEEAAAEILIGEILAGADNLLEGTDLPRASVPEEIEAHQEETNLQDVRSLTAEISLLLTLPHAIDVAMVDLKFALLITMVGASISLYHYLSQLPCTLLLLLLPLPGAFLFLLIIYTCCRISMFASN